MANKRKSTPNRVGSTPNRVGPISIHQRLTDAYELYHRTKQLADAAPTKTAMENYLRAHSLVSRLEREAKAAGLSKGVIARQRYPAGERFRFPANGEED